MAVGIKLTYASGIRIPTTADIDFFSNKAGEIF